MTAGLTEEFEAGLAAPICLTWELTYACNLSCVHCLSSSGRRDPRELDTRACLRLVDELADLGVFYVNVGGGEPTVRPDFRQIMDHAVQRAVGVKFSTNGVGITEPFARWVAGAGYVDVQVSVDGATAQVNDAVRGKGAFATAVTAMRRLAEAGVTGFKVSVVVTRENVGQLDALQALADRYAAVLRLTRLRPSGRGADSWQRLHLLPGQQRDLYSWLVERGEGVLTGDSFFHLGAYGQRLAGLNLCGAGRVVCLVDPVGDVYACPFAIHDRFRAGNVTDPGGLARVWRDGETFARLRAPQPAGSCGSCAAFDTCRGGCPAAKFFTGLPADGPDPECVLGHGRPALAAVDAGGRPRPDGDHSHHARRALPVLPVSPCRSDPLAGVAPAQARP